MNLAVIGLLISSVWSVGFKGDIYEMGSNRKTKLFTYEHKPSSELPDRDVENTYRTPDGSTAIQEKINFKNNALTHYEIEQKQLGNRGVVDIKDGKIVADYTKEGKKDHYEKEKKDNTILSPEITTFIRANWDKILKGDTVKAQLFVVDRLDTYSFEYYKVKEQTVDNQKEVVVKMKPGNLIVSALVDPLYFSFSPDGQKLLRLEGRTLPKRKVGEKWKDLDAETVYIY